MAKNNDDVSEEDHLDSQYLNMLLANEKEKDAKAYARMRQTKVGLPVTFVWHPSLLVCVEFEMETRKQSE